MTAAALLVAFVAGVWSPPPGSVRRALVLLPTAEAWLVVQPKDAPPLFGRGRWTVRGDSLCVVGTDRQACWSAAMRGADTLMLDGHPWVRSGDAISVPPGRSV